MTGGRNLKEKLLEPSRDQPPRIPRTTPSHRNIPLSPYAEPFNPRGQVLTRTSQNHQPTLAMFNQSNEAAYTRNHPPLHFQPLLQTGTPLAIYTRSGQNIRQNIVGTENLPLQRPMQRVFLPLNQVPMPNRNNLQYPLGISIPNNLTQFDRNKLQLSNAQNIPPNCHQLGPPLLMPAPLIHNRNHYHPQTKLILPNTQPILPSFGPRCVSNDFPKNATPIMDRTLGLTNPHGLLKPGQVNTMLPNPSKGIFSTNPSNSFQLRNHHIMTESSSSSIAHHPSNTMLPRSDQFLGPDAPPLPRAIKKNAIQMYKDESDIPWCDFHFFNLCARLPKRLIKGHGAPCFVCEFNAEAGIFIPEAGDMSGVQDEPEEAYTLPPSTFSAYHSVEPEANSLMAFNTSQLGEVKALPSMASSANQLSEANVHQESEFKALRSSENHHSETEAQASLDSSTNQHSQAKALPSTVSSTRQQSQNGAFSLMSSDKNQLSDSWANSSMDSCAHQHSKSNLLSSMANQGNEQRVHVPTQQFSTECQDKKSNSEKNESDETKQTDDKCSTDEEDNGRK